MENLITPPKAQCANDQCGASLPTHGVFRPMESIKWLPPSADPWQLFAEGKVNDALAAKSGAHDHHSGMKVNH
jgi:hypothetical protein